MIQTSPMKTRPAFTLAASLLGGVATGLCAEGIPLRQCPSPVVDTIKSQLGPGRIDGIQTVRADSRRLYLAEIDLPDDVDLLLVIGERGEILRRREEGDF